MEVLNGSIRPDESIPKDITHPRPDEQFDSLRIMLARDRRR